MAKVRFFWEKGYAVVISRVREVRAAAQKVSSDIVVETDMMGRGSYNTICTAEGTVKDLELLLSTIQEEHGRIVDHTSSIR